MINKLHPNKIPYLLVYDNKGNIYEDKRYYAVGQTGNNTVELTPNDFIELPFGSDLFFLPGRNPIGKNIKTGEIEIIDDKLAVSAFVAPAYTVTHHAAWNTNKNAPRLPLFAYSAVGWLNNKFYVPAIRIESDIRQDCEQFDQKKVISGAKKILKLKPENRLIKHLSYCALEYFCPAARNYFLNRWEAPLPTSPTCNSQCLGCISYQPKEHKISSTQNRITFVPTPQEIAEVAIDHLETAPNPVVSFGQGCEGEPTLIWKTLCDAIILIREKTKKGIINLNTNASNPKAIDEMCKVGLQSVRVSLNSARENIYNAYYKPRNYTFNDVLKSIEIARKHNIWISLNYFVFPGITDCEEEFNALKKLITNYNINMIQWRNFNIDPEWYIKETDYKFGSKLLGIKNIIDNIKLNYPTVYNGYFNPGKDVIDKFGIVK